MQVSTEIGRRIAQAPSARRGRHATPGTVLRMLPTRCRHCGGRVVRTDPMAAKSCNGCGRWAE